MMRFKVLYMVLVLSLTSVLFADKAPIRISAGKYYNQFSHKYYPQVTIISVSDKIIIKDENNLWNTKLSVVCFPVQFYSNKKRHRLQ